MNYCLEMFNILRWLIMASGSWQLEVEPKIQIPYKIYTWAFRFVYFCCTVMLYAKFFVSVGVDNDRTIELLAYVIANVCGTIKLFLATNKKMTNLFTIIMNDVPNLGEGDPEIEEFIRRYNNYVKGLSACSVFCSYFVWLSLPVYDTISECFRYRTAHPNATDNPEYVLYIWLPFSVQEHFSFALATQMFLSFQTCSMLYSSMAIFTSTMIYPIIKLMILQHRFRNFHRFPTELDSASGSVLRKQMAINNIKVLIKEHQDLIGFIKNLNENIKYAILLEYSISSLMMASVLVQILDGSKLYVFLPYGVNILLQIFILSWVADEIKVQSENIGMAVYESNWYTYDSEVRRLLYVVMIRAAKELSLDIGPFGPNNMDAAVARLKLAYSYISLMSGNSL